jgi:hypothetical protein
MNSPHDTDPGSDQNPAEPSVQDPSSPEVSWPSGEVCVPNISPAERRKRLNSGVVALVIGLAILTVLVLTGVDRWWRLPLFLFFASAASGFFQWRDKT